VTDSDVSVGLGGNVDHTEPVSSTPGAQSRRSPGDRENRQPKRPPNTEAEKTGEQAEPDAGASENQPAHKIDSLA